MSASSPALKDQDSSEPPASASTPSPWKNPSYPARTYWGERPALEEKLQAWDRKIATVAQKLAVLGTASSRAAHERLYHQMMGARDQMAEAVRRMPRETGALHHEDHERLVNAESALERLLRGWDALKS